MAAKTNRTVRKAKSSRLNWIIGGFVGLLILFAGFVMVTQLQSAKTAMPLEVTTAEAAKMRDQGAFILDVRQPEEWVQGHIPGATLIPLGELQARVNEVPKDQPVVVVCRSGNRSATGRDILLKSGFSQVTSMGGGMNSWAGAGYPTVTGQ